MKIKSYQDSYHIPIADLFVESVHSVPSSLYSKEELRAWAPEPPDYVLWRDRLALKQPFVAIKNNAIVGFIELECDGHIDCLYVHSRYQGQGVATRLFYHILGMAKANNLTQLYVKASKVAKPFFEKHGFRVEKTNSVSLRGQTLINYSMSLKIK